MPQLTSLSPCIEWQFAEAGPLEARLRAAHAAGFDKAEFHLLRNKDLAAVRLEYFPTLPMDQSADLTFKTLTV